MTSDEIRQERDFYHDQANSFYQKNLKLIEALEFYASRANYERDFGDDPAINCDYGEKARTAIKINDQTATLTEALSDFDKLSPENDAKLAALNWMKLWETELVQMADGTPHLVTIRHALIGEKP